MSGIHSLRREKTTKERDQWFIDRTLGNRKLNHNAKAIVVRLVKRYHWDVFTDINRMIVMNSPLDVETLLDNHEYVLGKFRNPTALQMECMLTIYAGNSSLCLLRKAPLADRRKAVAIVQLASELAEVDELPEGCFWQGASEQFTLSLPYIALAGKHSRRIPELVELIKQYPERTPAVIDTIMEDGIHSALLDGAL